MARMTTASNTCFRNLSKIPAFMSSRRLLGGHYSISRRARGRLATLLAIQEYRVPWMRDQMEVFMTGMMQRFTQSMLDAPGVAEDTLMKLGMADQLPMLEGMRKAFHNGDVHVGSEPNRQPSRDGLCAGAAPRHLFSDGMGSFWKQLPFLSSRVIARYTAITSPCAPDLPYEGLLDKRVQVRFPLSRTKMLVLRHDRRRIEMIEDLLRRKRRREAQKAIDRSTQIRHVRVGRADVEHINAHNHFNGGTLCFLVSGDARGSAAPTGVSV